MLIILVPPTGVSEAGRSRGVGRVLLLVCLHPMRREGYGYAIIGGVGLFEFYAKDRWSNHYRRLDSSTV